MFCGNDAILAQVPRPPKTEGALKGEHLMNTFKSRVEENYTAVLVMKNGKEKVEYVYSAPWYFWDSPDHRLSFDKLRLLIAAIISLAAFLACSLIRSEVNGLRGVDIAVAISACAHLFEMIAAIRLKAAKERVTRQTYDSVNHTLRITPLVNTLTMLCAAVMGFFMTERIVDGGTTIAVSCGYLLCAALAFLVRWLYIKLSFHTEKNTDLKKYDVIG